MGCENDSDTTPTMRELIEEQLVHLRAMAYEDATPDEEFDLAGWVADIGNFEGMAFGDDVSREAAAYAWGYLRGAAELADLTLDQLLDEYDLTWNEPAKPLRRSRRKVG